MARLSILHLFEATAFMGKPLQIAIIELYQEKNQFKLFIMDKNFLGMTDLMDGPWLNSIEEAMEEYLTKWEREQLIDEIDRNQIFEQL